MYRLLIVDDEPAIVDGLVLLFQEREDLDLDICNANSAVEAIELIKKTKIDVVLSDIRMPGKSGLQMIEDIVHYWPSCKIIFLTGYSEFDFVYEAIQRNVENYILKTEDDETVVAAVKEAIRKVEEESKRRSLIDKVGEQLKLTGQLLKTEFVRALLAGEPALPLLAEERFASLAQRLDRDAPVLLLCGTVDNWPEEWTFARKQDALYAVLNRFERDLPPSIAAEGAVCDQAALLWLLQPDAAAGERFRSASGGIELAGTDWYVKGLLEGVQNDCFAAHQVPVSFAISREAARWNDVGREFGTMKTELSKRLVPGQQMAVIDLGLPNAPLSPQPHSWPLQTEQEQKLALLLDRIHRFILGNLGGDLSLARIAEEVYFNPSYLSRFYKQLTGRNLSDFIQAAKTDAAVTMLANPKLKIGEIAQRLGFESPSYFTAFFRKMKGLTPQEYRETLRWE
ncbi:hypothetical protein SD70_11560 [Gordoniibacillus kamchatkensis]|uniref:DNA-binding response regulator n=1 Tax=Gordoniibacillus kamchatkensis TaxID=1590651 RepID=A0ABR5AIE8_9BACL|nr:response regulator [Paenibacillus sp. VKM B-2647]KIL40715.1 hypothetical protein SD70_11560 [Paenibacillus sp. VKM B-2647]